MSAIESEDRIMIMSGHEAPSREQLMRFIDAALGGREIDFGRIAVVAPEEKVPHIPTERERWNAEIEARKAAKKGRKP
jgi:hypothetical protein